jgi:hypothetical protein
MAKSFSRNLLHWLLALVAVTAVQPGVLMAQESLLNGSDQAARGPSSKAIEIASLATLPTAPELATSTSGMAAPAESAVAMVPAPIIEATVPTTEAAAHPFWDRENRILFAAAGGLAGADFCVTHANLAAGGRELNPITRVLSGTTPGLAANFVLETGSVIGISYLFHKTGHHRLERITSFLNIGSSAGAVAYGLAHR